MTFTKISVGGFASNVGKTTLVCDLLRAFGGWEAIKVTRGHYRSCGKDPHACCVSHLLSDEPRLLSGRAETYAQGKDTGRFWEAGAANVHWLVATDAQIERGIHDALRRVESSGVVIEGNSPLKFVDVDFFVMVAGRSIRMKPTARRVVERADAFYLDEKLSASAGASSLDEWREQDGLRGLDLPIYTREHLPELIAHIRAKLARRALGLGARTASQVPDTFEPWF